MGYPSKQQVLEAAKHLSFKDGGVFVRTNGLWHVLMFLRHKVCHGSVPAHTFESFDLVEAAFDLNGVTLPVNDQSRNAYFEPGATQGNDAHKLFRHREGPRQTYLNRMYTGLVGAGPRQPKLFDATNNALPTTLNLVTDWISVLRGLGDNKYVLDSQIQSLMTWLFRFGVPTRAGHTANIAEHLGNGRLIRSAAVSQSPIPSGRDEFATELQKFLGLSDEEIKLLFPQLRQVNPEVWTQDAAISTETLSDELLSCFGVSPADGTTDRETGQSALNVSGVVGANWIFFGPPGTGKSTEAKEMVGGAAIERTQFHPEYSHADFIGSYRPVVGFESGPANEVVGHDGVIIARPINYFAFVPGPLTLALERAFQSADHVFLVIEEINRGDCAAIFGDTFQLLDRNDQGRSEFGITPKSELVAYFKGRSINYDIAGNGKLYLPPNLTLLATMNTSDQSLYPMDSAFKRRWQWVGCPIDFSQLLAYTEGVRPFLDDGTTKWDWIKMVESLNNNIVRDRMEDKQLGPWFIKPAKGGLVPWESFLNKCLFYLWHDVFKDEQLSDLSPFKTNGPQVFSEVQRNIRENGLAAGIKPEILWPLAEPAGPHTSDPPQGLGGNQTTN